MRIIGGAWRGRTIVVPKGTAIRPTADRAREAWMSIVMPWLPGARVLDLCAGSGALGLEALSRGAAHADFVDSSPVALATIRRNAESLRATDVTLVRQDALRFVERLAAGAYDVAFADPPYDGPLARQLAAQWERVPFANLFGVEHSAEERLPGGETRKYGSAAITIFRFELPPDFATLTSA